MRLWPTTGRGSGARAGSVLIIVLWIALGMVAITLYFASSMGFEARVSDNRWSGLAAEQAIEGAIRYVSAVLSNSQATNGVVPDVSTYFCEAVPVGDCRFWLIGRAGDYQVQPDQVFFGLTDEGGKLNLNSVSADMLNYLTNMTPELAANIVDWRDTNGNTSANGDGPAVYSQFQPAYMCKNSAYETIDELRLVYPMDLSTLFGEDVNLNGALDPSEIDTNRNNTVDPGLLEYVTVYTSEPSTPPGGTAPVNISSLNYSQLTSLLTNLSSSRITQIASNLGLSQSPAGGGGGGGRPGNGAGGGPGSTTPATVTITSALDFFLKSKMTSDEFATVATNITVSTNSVIVGRVNINTASQAVLACLPGVGPDLAQQLVAYRRQNSGNLTSIAWLADALGSSGTSALQSLAAGDYITTRSYQFGADIAALGPYGRGYKRVRCIFDMSSGTPRILYRQDLTHLGWALGRYVRDTWLLAKDSR